MCHMKACTPNALTSSRVLPPISGHALVKMLCSKRYSSICLSGLPLKKHGALKGDGYHLKPANAPNNIFFMMATAASSWLATLEPTNMSFSFL